MPQTSIGGTLHYIKVVPSMQQQLKDNPPLEEISRHIREEALIATIDLPEEYFMQVARGVLRRGQKDLIPLLTRLLEAHGSQEAKQILIKESERAGAPLVRDYCNLALFRSNVDGPFEEQLRNWISRQQHRDLIQLRPLLPWNKRSKKQNSPHTLNAEESSALLIESFEALAQRHDEVAINTLLYAIEHGNPHNRYALAGLLIRLTE